MMIQPNQAMEEAARLVEHRAQEAVVDLARKLISIPSENHPPGGDEGQCQEYIAQRLRADGLSVDVFEPTDVDGITEHAAFLHGRNYDGRPNVVGRWKGAGGGRSLILSGHIDVVPPTEEPSGKYPPFAAMIDGDHLHGRGAWDMKGGLAAALAAIEILKEEGIRLAGDVLFESVVDEEYAGANGTLACRLRGYHADAAIIPECGAMEIWIATRSGQALKFTVSREAREAGLPCSPQDNPISGMARVIEGLTAFKDIYDARRPPHPLYKDSRDKVTMLIAHLKAGDVRPNGLIGVPDECWLRVWMETPPDADGNRFLDGELKPFFQSLAATDPALHRMKLDIVREGRFLEGSEISPDHPFVPVLRSCAARVLKSAPRVCGAVIGSDAAMFTRHGATPAVVMGPSGGGAHAANEYVSIRDLADLTRVFALTMVEWCGRA